METNMDINMIMTVDIMLVNMLICWLLQSCG